MSKLLNTVNQRTQLAGENRLELLLFRLEDKQLYGINVFKVKKIITCPITLKRTFCRLGHASRLSIGCMRCPLSQSFKT